MAMKPHATLGPKGRVRKGAPRDNSRYGSPSVLTAFYAYEYDDPDARYYRRRRAPPPPP
jgi:hypothetical protein